MVDEGSHAESLGVEAMRSEEAEGSGEVDCLVGAGKAEGGTMWDETAANAEVEEDGEAGAVAMPMEVASTEFPVSACRAPLIPDSGSRITTSSKGDESRMASTTTNVVN